MPHIRCVNCGEQIFIDPFATPYDGELACPKCRTVMEVKIDNVKGTVVKRKYPDFDVGFKGLISAGYFTREEILFLVESSLCIGAGAYTAAELSALKALESVLRRLYGKDETLGVLLEDVEKDPKLKKRGIAGIIAYFKDVRNRTAHPDRVSGKLEAESTFQMIQRLLSDIVEIYAEKLKVAES